MAIGVRGSDRTGRCEEGGEVHVERARPPGHRRSHGPPARPRRAGAGTSWCARGCRHGSTRRTWGDHGRPARGRCRVPARPCPDTRAESAGPACASTHADGRRWTTSASCSLEKRGSSASPCRNTKGRTPEVVAVIGEIREHRADDRIARRVVDHGAHLRRNAPRYRAARRPDIVPDQWSSRSSTSAGPAARPSSRSFGLARLVTANLRGFPETDAASGRVDLGRQGTRATPPERPRRRRAARGAVLE